MAKKKYYQSAKDRSSESRGMERKLRGPKMMRDGYEAIDPRRRLEYEDSMILNEDPNAIANLPQDVKYHKWPRTSSGPQYNIDDTVHGVDVQMDKDMKGFKREFDPEKY